MKMSPNRRPGFTLVELLVVITIIGAIAAIAIPAIGAVMRTVRANAMRAELTNIESGIDDYFTKYGDYPPDFSDWNVVRRHYLKIFPDIATSELNLLFRLCDDMADDNANQNTATTNYNPLIMDRAEAIVWSLGGFSADPQFPFTGAGGPLVRIPGATGPVADPASYEYNPTRNSPAVDFNPERLSLETFDPSAAKSYTNRNQSDDEAAAGIPLADLFPSYVLREDASPVVYFDSRTYLVFTPAPSPTDALFNRYERTLSGGFDVIRPMYSEIANDPPNGAYGTVPGAAIGWKFMNERTYQLMAPGLDGLYGDLGDIDGGDPNDNVAAFFQVGGTLIIPDTTATVPEQLKSTSVTRFDVSSVNPRTNNPMLDNISNFIDGEFETTIP